MAMLYGPLLVIEELEQIEERNRARIVRRLIRDAQDPFRVSENEFRSQFRLSRAACLDLINALEPHMVDAVLTNRIPKMLRVLAALHFFGVGNYQRSAGSNSLVCISQSVVSRSIREVTNIILRHLLRTWVKFPRNAQTKESLKQRFLQRHGMHDIISVVDGSQVAIVKPHENENIYVNRKGYHSLNVQIICDADLRITSAVSRWPGSSHDAFVWRSSRIGQIMRANHENGDQNSKVMGDSGYPCLPWLLVPLANPRTPQEVLYNNTFKRCRSLVERCIGLLKGRFRCLLKDRTLHYSPQTSARIILCCVVLHNISIHYRVENPQPMWDEIDLEHVPEPQFVVQHDIHYRQIGQETRRRYITEHF